MSQTESSPYIRDNWFADEEDDENRDDQREREVAGHDAAEQLAFQHALELLNPLCGHHKYGDPDRGWQPHADAEGIEYTPGHNGLAMHEDNDEVQLTDPCLILPREDSRGVDYSAEAGRRRYNPVTGYISHGETTGITLRPLTETEYYKAFSNYLCERIGNDNLRLTAVDDYLQNAKRHWHDQNQSGIEALGNAIAFVREKEPLTHCD